MRPISIRRFEWVYAARIVVAMIGAVVDAAYARPTEGDPTALGRYNALFASVFILFIVEIALLYAASRKAKRWARGCITVLFVLTLCTLPLSLISYWNDLMVSDTIILPITNNALAALSVWFLFRPDSNLWFSGHLKTSDLRDTFR